MAENSLNASPVKRRAMRMTEAQLQKQICMYLAVALKKTAWFSTFPADRASSRGKIGLKLGVPDILIIHDGRAYWLEIKLPGKKVRDTQAETHLSLMFAGSPVEVVYELIDVVRALQYWQIPTNPVRL